MATGGIMRSDSRRVEDGARAYRIAWLGLLFGSGCAIAVLFATGMFIDLVALFPYATIITLLFSVHLVYSKYRPRPVLARAAGSFGLMIVSALAAGIIANAGMRLNYPLIDAQLASADRAMGIDTSAIVRTTAGSPALAGLLGLAYTSIFPLCFATALLLAVQGKTRRLGELTVGFGVGIVISAITSVFCPALGNFIYAGLEQLAGTSLPAGSGIYHLHAVAAYRDGLDRLLDVSKLEGVVTFPSFHMVMAIVVAYAFRSTGFLGWLMYIWCGMVAVSTIPIGGHYVIDLVGGTVLWAMLRWACAERRMARSHIRHPAPTAVTGVLSYEGSRPAE